MIENKKVKLNFKKIKEKALKCLIKMEVWVAVLKRDKKERKEIIIVFVLMMKHRLKTNNRILINPLMVRLNFC